jgi:hypothetical protein
MEKIIVNEEKGILEILRDIHQVGTDLNRMLAAEMCPECGGDIVAGRCQTAGCGQNPGEVAAY